MPHRRKGRRLAQHRLASETRPCFLRFLPQSKRLPARVHRARTRAAIDAVLDPRRRTQRPRVARGKGAGKVSHHRRIPAK